MALIGSLDGIIGIQAIKGVKHDSWVYCTLIH